MKHHKPCKFWAIFIDGGMVGFDGALIIYPSRAAARKDQKKYVKQKATVKQVIVRPVEVKL